MNSSMGKGNFLFFISSIIVFFFFNGYSEKKIENLKYTKKIKLKIPEPSDFCTGANGEGFIFVSDQGMIYFTDNDLKVTKKFGGNWMDLEGCCMVEKNLLVVDESLRKISVINPLEEKIIRNISIPFSGARNRGFESIGFNPELKNYWLITEKQPCTVFELDSAFSVINERQFPWLKEASGICFHNNYWWILSDEEREFYKVSQQGDLLQKYKIGVHNPEGIAFNKKGECLILSDDLSSIYFFDIQ
jgi:hypothetical protein